MRRGLHRTARETTSCLYPPLLLLNFSYTGSKLAGPEKSACGSRGGNAHVDLGFEAVCVDGCTRLDSSSPPSSVKPRAAETKRRLGVVNAFR